MIPVKKQPKPADFEKKVAKKGRKFLEQTPSPHSWKNGSYWTEVLPDLREAYRGICAYCCHYIPGEQNASVDHFIPKSIAPHLAYEWDNYRLATLKMNARKGDSTDILDPFKLIEGTFILLFPAMQLKPNPELPNALKIQASKTIERLGLNKDDLVNSRLKWVLDYCDGRFDFEYLKGNTPFIASEIERQNLQNKLALMFKRRNI